ncbi:MAG: hypothetical protein JST86_00790 [Bacteroidetes bacterium]|nr:hypothetical protein [Bacteroidota bacterium]
MERKKWTPQTEVTDTLLKFREKRKWQLALRRYILEKKPSTAYAPYFGMDVNGFRGWIELQFTKDLNWENFAKAWQFDHIVPVTYFDFDNEQDLRLCWNFMNIRVERLELNKNRGNRIDVFAVKPYFQTLYDKTGYSFCLKMIDKLAQIEVSSIESYPAIENFIIKNKEHLENISTLNREEFEKFNLGAPLKDILLEREILRKFGG